jgi:hypothetical protein
MVGLAFRLSRQDDLEGAEALYREAVEAGDADWSGHASFALGTLLNRTGNVAGAKAAWQRLIDANTPEWAAAAFTGLVNLLEQQEDADGLRAAYRSGATLGNPDAPYALFQLGGLLSELGDTDGAHEAWQQAIDAGCADPDSVRELMSPDPEPQPDPLARPYPPGLPPRFDPANMIRAGIDVLEHGLPPLPEVLTYDMAVPVAYWTAECCAVVLILRFIRLGHDDRHAPLALIVEYSRGEDGGWVSPRHVVGGSFSHDPISSPDSMRDLGGNPMVHGGSSQAREVTPGRPASVVRGRAGPEVKYLASIKDGHEDRRPLESYFGAWVVCTEQPGPFDVVGRDASGVVLGVLEYGSGPPRW